MVSENFIKLAIFFSIATRCGLAGRYYIFIEGALVAEKLKSCA
jgi:hypothetical protein